MKSAAPTRRTASAYRASRGMPAPRRDLRGGYSSTWRGSSQLGAEASPRPCRELPARRSLFPGATGAYPTGVRRGAATGTRVGWPSWRSRSSPVAFQGSPSSHAGIGSGSGVAERRGGRSCGGVGAGRVERPARNAGASSGAAAVGSGASSASPADTAAAGSLPSNAASSASPCAAEPSGTGGPADPAAAAPIVAAPAAEPHGGGAVQSLADPPDRDVGPTDGGGRPPGSSPPRARSAPPRRPSRAPPRAVPNPRRSGSPRTSRTGSTRPGGRGPAARRGSPRSTGGGGRGPAPGDRGRHRGRRTGRRPADRRCARSRRDDTRCGRGSIPAATRCGRRRPSAAGPPPRSPAA